MPSRIHLALSWIIPEPGKYVIGVRVDGSPGGAVVSSLGREPQDRGNKKN